MKSVSTTTPLRWSAISNALIALACSYYGSTMSELELHDRVIARWRARLLQHGPESDLGREARRQLIKLEAERIRMVERL